MYCNPNVQNSNLLYLDLKFSVVQTIPVVYFILFINGSGFYSQLLLLHIQVDNTFLKFVCNCSSLYLLFYTYLNYRVCLTKAMIFQTFRYIFILLASLFTNDRAINYFKPCLSDFELHQCIRRMFQTTILIPKCVNADQKYDFYYIP